jgi:outer membrane biosynthesis protein TonB
MKLTFAGCVSAAVVLHGALALAVCRRGAPAPEPRILEMDIAGPTVAPPPVPPVETSAPEPPPVARVASRAAAPAAPQAARAAPLLTASDAAKPPASDEPVSFVTDPNGTFYGSGVVARGGTADHGAPNASVNGAPGGTATGPSRPAAPAATAGDAITPASDLSRVPRLGEADACRGWFPRTASSDSATVSLLVIVRPSGAVASVSLLSESPAGEGFGAAARSCLAAKRFTPALDRAGGATTAAARINLRFSR